MVEPSSLHSHESSQDGNPKNPPSHWSQLSPTTLGCKYIFHYCHNCYQQLPQHHMYMVLDQGSQRIQVRVHHIYHRQCVPCKDIFHQLDHNCCQLNHRDYIRNLGSFLQNVLQHTGHKQEIRQIHQHMHHICPQKH